MISIKATVWKKSTKKKKYNHFQLAFGGKAKFAVLLPFTPFTMAICFSCALLCSASISLLFTRVGLGYWWVLISTAKSILTFDCVLLYLAKVNPSESPYNQVPIFPLIPNRDVLVKGKPKKDVQKLDVQRKMEPISTFEDHFLHKKRWIKQIVSIQFHFC